MSATEMKSAIHPKKTDREKNLTQMAIPSIYYVLKQFSSKEKPLSAREIADYVNELMEDPTVPLSSGNVLPENRIKEKLNMLATMSVAEGNQIILAPEEAIFRNAMCLTFGGIIVEEKRIDPLFPQKKPHAKYYFKPLLDHADIDMICGAIASNRFFSEEEKEYLFSRQEALGAFQMNERIDESGYRMSINTQTLPQKPKSKKNSMRTNKTSQDMLRIINKLYYAISNGYKVRMIYARYTQKRSSMSNTPILFAPVHDGKEYHLNPYATLWNRGELYLLATLDSDPEQPRHYRVDRIFDLHIEKEKVNPLPEVLNYYRKQSSRTFRNVEIDTAKYTAEHPLMGIAPNENEMITCCVECDNRSLPVLVDTFGSSISIKPSPIDHADDILTDINGEPVTFYLATVRHVHVKCMELYCLHHASSFHVIYPVEMRNRIADVLEQQAQELRLLPDLSEADLF